jgi:hypothetical protein
MKITVPAGKYFLGDPCYAVPDELWDDLLNDAKYFQKKATGKVAGHRVVSFNTAYGDGCFAASDGCSYCVDAGMIGLTPVELIKTNQRYSDEQLKSLGRFVEFNDKTECAANRGRMRFGDIVIDTRTGY